jgi:AcrR family transcriptional regulator
MSKPEIINTPKRSGRKPKAQDGAASNNLNKELVLAHALKLLQNETADVVTIARLAADLGVSTGLIHYFVGSRDALLATILNERRKVFALELKIPKGNWRRQLESLLVQTHESKLTWKGVTTYLAENNRHRLFHDIQPGERDYGLLYFDTFGRIMQSGGFSGTQAAHAYHLSMLFLESVAISHIRHRVPSDHNRFLIQHMAQFDQQEYAGAAFMMTSFAKIDTKTTFKSGLKVLLDSFEAWLAKNSIPRKLPKQPGKPL